MKRTLLAGIVAALAATTFTVPPAIAAPNDALWKQQYGPQQIHAEAAWTKTTGKDVKVAVVDTGVDLDHPDLKANLIQGRNFGNEGGPNNPDDKDTHGTHVAGTIAAVTNNGIGVAGVAPNVKIIPIRVIAEEGNSSGDPNPTISAAQAAIRWGVQQGAKVINLSMDESRYFAIGLLSRDGIVAGCEEAYRAGALCVVSAGNSGADKNSEYSAGFNALVVSANDKNKKQASFAQKANTNMSVTAPGVNVVSTLKDGGYGALSGTSMSAPHVSGLAALLFATGMSNAQVAQRIMDTAIPVGDWAGSGLIDAAAALGVPAGEDGSSAVRSDITQPVRSSGGATATTAAPSRSGTGKKGDTATTVATTPGDPSAGAGPDQLRGDPGMDDLPSAGGGTGDLETAAAEGPADTIDGRWYLIGFAGLLVLAVSGWTWSVAGAERARKSLGG